MDVRALRLASLFAKDIEGIGPDVGEVLGSVCFDGKTNAVSTVQILQQ